MNCHEVHLKPAGFLPAFPRVMEPRQQNAQYLKAASHATAFFEDLVYICISNSNHITAVALITGQKIRNDNSLLQTQTSPFINSHRGTNVPPVKL